MKIHESPQLFPGCFILGPIPTPIPTPEPASHLARSGISRLGGRSTWVESDPCCYAAPKWWSWQVLTGKTWETYWKLGKYGNMRLWTYIPLLMLYWAYQYGGEHQKGPPLSKWCFHVGWTSSSWAICTMANCNSNLPERISIVHPSAIVVDLPLIMIPHRMFHRVFLDLHQKMMSFPWVSPKKRWISMGFPWFSMGFPTSLVLHTPFPEIPCPTADLGVPHGPGRAGEYR